MGLARCLSVALVGVDAHVVEVEVDVGAGIPEFTLAALSDRVLKEARHRVRAAMTNSGEHWPNRRTTVALSPATVPKAGSRFDLAIAVTLAAASDAVRADALQEWVVLGELGLDGAVKAVTGVLPSVIGAYRNGRRRFVVPSANLREASLVTGCRIVGVGSLREMCAWLRGDIAEPSCDVRPSIGAPAQSDSPLDFADVLGQPLARRGIEVAAAGGHHVLMSGPPGVGKTMIAERLPGILPALSEDEALEVTGLHSIAGLLRDGAPLVTQPPFCAPHHTASAAAVVGGGTGLASPGAVSIANRGVLFLDEAPEFHPKVLEALREPVESGVVTIARSAGVVTYPARFLLVMAANPCPCAAAGRDSTQRHCGCPAAARRTYNARISGPFRDRLDVMVDLEPVSHAALVAGATAEASAVIKERVVVARDRARHRLRETQWSVNAHVPGPVLRRRWPLAPVALRPLQRQMDRGQLSTRGLDRVAKIAWTIADLAGRGQPGLDEASEALALRSGPWAGHADVARIA